MKQWKERLWRKWNQRRTAGFQSDLLVLLVAIELLMSFTFFGYLHLPPISLTFAYLPILVAGCFLGIPQATALGVVFGVSSLYKATAYYVQPFDQLFSPLMSGFPAGSILLSVGTRTLFGLLMGLAFWAAKRSRHIRLWIGAVAAAAPKIHAVLVFAAMGALFPKSGYTIQNALPLTVSDGLQMLLCVVLIEGLWRVSRWDVLRNFYTYVEQFSGTSYKDRHILWAWVSFLSCGICASVAATAYFSQRINYMLSVYDVEITSHIAGDLRHLHTQLLLANLSLYIIMAFSLILVYKYLAYREYLGELDALTGVMGRKMFVHHCNELQRGHRSSRVREGCFLFIDVDRFKSINDTFGHPTGDSVLREIAAALERIFSDCGKVGRMGGDEFAVILEQNLPFHRLSRKLERFQSEIAQILSKQRVTCSIGVCQFSYPQNMKTIYAETDRLLYLAKERGRAQYVAGRYDQTGLHLREDTEPEQHAFDAPST